MPHVFSFSSSMVIRPTNTSACLGFAKNSLQMGSVGALVNKDPHASLYFNDGDYKWFDDGSQHSWDFVW